MSTTTQILFNSPALHSLRRDQLVKLCKIHSLKPAGKKTELIERLQLHAKTLPPDDPLSVATRSENLDAGLVVDSEDEVSDRSASGEGSSSMPGTITRPSEQWEVVMDAIEEVDEDTKGSLRSNGGVSNTSAGEFGTNGSKGAVTSSLRAIANSLGLKRNPSKMDATTSSTSSNSSKEAGPSSSTPPTSDPNVDSEGPPVPIPGQTNLEGIPAPSNARLSFSQAQATTTVRLVSTAPQGSDLLLSPPKLKPFATTFDLVPPTPRGTDSASIPVWPLSPGGAARDSLYPAIPTFEAFGNLLTHSTPRSGQADASDMDIDVDMPGGLAIPSILEPIPRRSSNSARFNTGATPRSTEKPSAQPVDIFSPAPKPQNATARSRTALPRSEPFMFGSQQPRHSMSNLEFRLAAQSVLDEMNKRLAEDGVESIGANILNNRPSTTDTKEEVQPKGPPPAGDVFDKVHQKAFDKMDSIATHYAAKRGVPSTAAQPIVSKKRKSSLVVKERKPGVPAARHRPSHNRVASGASARSILTDGVGEEEDEDEDVAERRLSKRPRVEREEADAPTPPGQVSRPPPPDPEEEAVKQREREAIRRRLEHNKAKRRSSMGRPSLGRAPPPQPKPSRFGFLSSAKTLVQNVWNRGAGAKTPAAKPPPETKAPPKAPQSKKMAVVPGSSGVPPLGSQTRRTPSGGSSSGQPTASGRPTLAPPATSTATRSTSTSSRTLRAPIPSFDPPSSSNLVNTRAATVGRNQSKSNLNIGFSSLGGKPSIPSGSGQVSSLGRKPSSRTLATNAPKPPSAIPRVRTMSTLTAPTASSLAKANRAAENSSVTKAGSSSKSQRFAMSPPPSAALEQITNSPRSPADAVRPTKIFSQPLSPPPSRIPMSLTGTATSIVGKVAAEKTASSSKPPLPPKPKVLPGRRPRISRSKVIAKLASQREAGASAGATPGARSEKSRGKMRSSIGAGVAGKTRQSYAGAKGGDVLISAKKRVRQSEYARRKSRVEAGDGAMAVDS